MIQIGDTSTEIKANKIKVGVEGSNPFARSNIYNNFMYLQSKYMLVLFQFKKLGGNLAEEIVSDVLPESRTGEILRQARGIKTLKI